MKAILSVLPRNCAQGTRYRSSLLTGRSVQSRQAPVHQGRSPRPPSQPRPDKARSSDKGDASGTPRIEPHVVAGNGVEGRLKHVHQPGECDKGLTSLIRGRLTRMDGQAQPAHAFANRPSPRWWPFFEELED